MRTRTKAILAAGGAAAVLGLGGAAVAVAMPPQTPPPVTAGRFDMNAMHSSPAMQQMRSQMPAELREQCDKMHAQMGATGMGQMMGGGSR